MNYQVNLDPSPSRTSMTLIDVHALIEHIDTPEPKPTSSMRLNSDSCPLYFPETSISIPGLVC